MKTKLPILIGLFLAGAALSIPQPTFAKGRESPTPKTSASESASAGTKKPRALPFHGKIASVDASARTFTVGKRTSKMVDETKITKEGAEVSMSDLSESVMVGGSYWKKEDGSLEAKTVKLKTAAPEKSDKETEKKDGQ